VRWGQPVTPGDDFVVEATPAQKLRYLEAIWQEKHRVDGNYAWVDIRFDMPTVPSTSPAQTAKADIRQ
jgi:hypothetical protein